MPPISEQVAADPRHRRWEDAWILETDHYCIRSNRPLLEACRYGRLAEMLYRAFFDFAGSRVERPAGRMGLYLFADPGSMAPTARRP